MRKSRKIICFIPARSGSKRLKNKNIKILNNKPLIYWTVKSAILSNVFEKIIFSTDSLKYYSILIKYLKNENLPINKIVLDLRNKNNSSSKKKIFDYIKYDLSKSVHLYNKDLLVQLLPTAPLRSLKTIKNAIKLALQKKKNIFSASKYDFHVSFAFKKKKNHEWISLFKDSPLKNGNTRSQNQETFYKPNPIINCLWINNIKKNKTIYDNALAYITSRIEGLDIDNIEDFRLAEYFIKLKYI